MTRKSALSLLILLIFLGALHCLIVPKILLRYYYFPSDNSFKSNNTKVKDIYITTPDGETLNLWLLKPHGNNPTVIFCHGDGGNISDFQSIIKPFADAGYGLVLFDYRGFGNSSGQTGEKGVYTDLNTVIEYLKRTQHLNEKRMVLWGYSFGGAVATEVAAHKKFMGVILHSTFTNAKEMRIFEIEQKFGVKKGSVTDSFIKTYINSIPSRQFDTKNKLKHITSPVLIAHDVPDQVVPVEMSYELLKASPNAKAYISPKGSHTDFSWIIGEIIKYVKGLQLK